MASTISSIRSFGQPRGILIAAEHVRESLSTASSVDSPFSLACDGPAVHQLFRLSTLHHEARTSAHFRRTVIPMLEQGDGFKDLQHSFSLVIKETRE